MVSRTHGAQDQRISTYRDGHDSLDAGCGELCLDAGEVLLPVDPVLHRLAGHLPRLLDLVVPVLGALHPIRAGRSTEEERDLLSDGVRRRGHRGLDEPRVSRERLLDRRDGEQLSRTGSVGSRLLGLADELGEGRRKDGREAVEEVEERVGGKVLGRRTRGRVEHDRRRPGHEPASDGARQLDRLALERGDREVEQVALCPVLGRGRVPGRDTVRLDA